MANPKYPKNYDDEQTTTPPFLPTASQTTDVADYINRIKKSVVVVERELGINPSGAQATVSERLDLIEGSDGYTSNHGESIHRVQIADKYSLNDVYNNYLVVGQVALNGLQETNLGNSSTSEVTVILKEHVYVQTNTVLTTRLYDITTGAAKLIKEFIFNDGYGYVGGHFTQEIQLNIVSDIPLSDRVYELRALQTTVGTTIEKEKSIIWDASLILKSTNTPVDDGYAVGEGIGAISPIAVQATAAGVAVTPGWTVISAFVYVGTNAKLQAMVLVSQAALTVGVRLYGPINGSPAAVTGSTITSTSISEEVIESANLATNLVTGGIYQIQMECTGGALVTDFAIARYAALVII